MFPRTVFGALCALLITAMICAPRAAEARQDQLPRTRLLETSESIKYWVFFRGKAASSGKAPAHVTRRAMDRRARRATAAPQQLDDPVNEANVEAVRRAGGDVVVISRWLNAVSAFLSEREAQVVARLPQVREVRIVGGVTTNESNALPVMPVALPTRNEPGAPRRLNYGASETQLALINAIPNLEAGINGTGVRIGFLDTEFGEFTHPTFAALVADGRLIATTNFAEGPQTSRHGLSVASTAVGFTEGSLIGTAYGAEVLAATTEYAPTETNQEEDNLVAGFEWMEANGADVINISLGYSTFDAGQVSYTTADLDGDTGVTTIAADLAAQLGVVVVTSAGNEGSSSWRLITMPADADSVITVGAVTSSGARSSFSSLGPTADGRTKPDVAAMGSAVQHAVSSGGFGSGNGTSFSSPTAAGVVAQMLQVNPDLNPIEVRDILRATGSQAANPDNQLGWGILDAEMAVSQATPVGFADTAEGPLVVSPPYPNPMRTGTTIGVTAAAPGGLVQLSVYNLLGRRVSDVVERRLQTGYNALTWRPDGLPAGLYLYRLQGVGLNHAGKFVVLRP